MPRATANIVEPIRKDLKSLPEGFVEFRRLSYGEKLERRALSGKAAMEQQGGGRRNMKVTMDLINKRSTLYDFQHCIIDHNLEDDDGRKLDLHNQADIDKLDPRVGEEIEQALDEINNFEEDDEGN